MPLENPWFLCRSHTRYPRLLKAALNVFAAEELTLDGPEDLTDKTTAQTCFYTHRGLDEQASSIRPGALTPDTPPASRPESVDRPQGFGKGDWQNFLEDVLSRLTLRLDQGSPLIYASFVKRPHRNTAT
jgi:hypothetical protein